MDQKRLTGQRIRERRKFKGWKLDDLAKATDMNISTLSKIETADPHYNASDEALKRIADALETKVENLRFGSGNYKIGIGACLWSAPLLYMINEDKIPTKFSVAYRSDSDGVPIYHDANLIQTISKDVATEEGALKGIKSSEKAKGKKVPKLLTAPELIDLMLSNDLDLIFVPRGTYENVSHSVFQCASIVDTVRGGLEILVVTKVKKSFNDVLNDFKEKNKRSILFHGISTVAEQVASKIFLGDEKSKIELSPIEINDLDEFTEKFLEHIGDSANKENYYVGYIGWEPHISLLKTALIRSSIEKEYIHVFGLSHIIDPDQPFQHINFDCIINLEKVESFKQSNDLIDFFASLGRAIDDLNGNKVYAKVHRTIQEIASNLSMKGEDALKSLRKINFELTFSKEWELFKSKSSNQ